MPELLEEILRAVLGAFFGTVGFAMLVHTPRRAWLASGLIAAFSYLVYWGLVRFGFSDPASIFAGSGFFPLLLLSTTRSQTPSPFS